VTRKTVALKHQYAKSINMSRSRGLIDLCVGEGLCDERRILADNDMLPETAFIE
jgi:hypothetical protein